MKKIKWNKLSVVLHRDLGYFFTGLIIIYCISGIALNHIDDWNPDFIMQRDTVQIDEQYSYKTFDREAAVHVTEIIGEEKFKLFDFPTNNQVKIYYEDATFHLNMETRKGVYEQIRKRPLFYQTNVLHRNSLAGWKWVSDIFGFMLILITITGLFVLKGKNSLTRRGKWFIMAGIIPPAIAILIHTLF